MLIQCKADLFAEITNIMHPCKPIIRELKGGYINLFDKDWIFMYIDAKVFPAELNKIAELAQEHQCLVADRERITLLQNKVAEIEQYIFIRRTGPDDTYEVLHGWSSCIVFERGDDNE